MIKTLVKAMLPAPIRHMIAHTRSGERQAIAALFSSWRDLRSAQARRPRAGDLRRVLILPSDPYTLVGSLGDGAMLASLVDRLRGAGRDVQFDILTASPSGSRAAAGLGFLPHEIAVDPEFLQKFCRLIDRRKIHAFIAVGADVLDGHYDPVAAARMLSAADIAARRGLTSLVLGFSFNAQPAPALKPFFDGLDPAVDVNVRDAVSQERLSRFSAVKTRLVADVAFCLRPLACPPEAEAWVAARRAEGLVVVALNLHPALVSEGGIGSMAEAVLAVSARQPVAWMLLAHDHRPKVGDAACLVPLGDRLAEALGERVFHLDGVHPPGAVKALVSRMDGVVTGRMHLAVAALGSGIPALSITYQGKFAGLYRHFDLPDDLMLAPEALKDAAILAARLHAFIDRIPALAGQVEARLASVQALSRRNFEVLERAGVVP